MAERLGESVLRLSTDNNALNSGIDSARAAGQGLETSFTGIADSIKAAFAAIGIGIGLREILNATMEAETAYRLLENSVRATGMSAGFTAEQLRAQSAALQEATTFGDEAIQDTQRAIMAFRNIHGEVFRDTTRLVLDFATATGRDAATAARTLGMAINDPVNGLTRLRQAGVAVTDSLREQVEEHVRAGDLQAAQRVILDELTKAYGGTAAAARDTLGGALESLKNRFGDLFLEQQSAGNQLRQFVQLVEESLPTVSAVFSATFAAIRTVVEGLVEQLFFLGSGLSRLVKLDLQGAMDAFAQMPGFVNIGTESVKNATTAFNEARDAIRNMDKANRDLAASAPVSAGIVKESAAEMQAALQKAEKDKSLKKLQDDTAKAGQQMKRLEQQTGQSFGAIAGDLVQGKMGFEDFGRAVIQAIAQMITQLIALRAAASFLGGFGGGFAGSLLGGFGGGRAAGGPVTAGTTYLVGERGPELFTPSRSGFIHPNADGGRSVNVTQQLYVDGADFSDPESIARIARGLAAAARDGVTEVLDASVEMANTAALNPQRLTA